MFAPVFVNALNPQLRLLAEFIAAMANGNEEATTRVFGDGITFYQRDGSWYVRSLKTQALDAMVAQVPDTVPEKSDVERQEMLMAIFEKVKEVNR